MKVKEFYNVAIYLRLSRDVISTGNDIDSGRAESNSISSQRDMIRSYIRKHKDMEIYDIYVDDGFSGANFDRPAFKRMMEDIEAGRIDCVIVKDLSRLGRDYIEAGRLIQKTFPAFSVRFIALTDNFDSLTADYNETSLVLPVKNFVNDSYCRDISSKVRSHQKVKRENGEFIGAFCVYGYKKSSENRNVLVPDEYAADIVKKIFLWKLEGYSTSAIAERLNQLGDAGDVEYGKTEREQVGGRNVLKARAEWKMIRNHHAPVIAREDFEEVQKSRGKSRGKGQKSRHPLIGRAVCGCCKRNLSVKMGLNPNFTCHNRYVIGLEGCVSQVNVMFLEQAVLFRLEEHLESQNLAAEASQRYRDGLAGKRDELLRDLKQVEREYGRMKQQHYEGYQLYSLGEQTEFKSLHAEMEKQQEVISDLQGQVIKVEEQLGRVESKKFAPEEDVLLTSETMARYVDSILVYNEEEIEIRWKELQSDFAMV